MAERSMNFEGNSQSKKAPSQPVEERKKLARVVSSKVTTRKKTLGEKIRDFFTGDEARSVVHYILTDVIVPAGRDMLYDAISQGADRAVYGESRRGTRSRSRSSSSSWTSYSTRSTSSDNDRPGGPRAMSHRGRANHDFAEILIESRAEIDEVIDRMHEHVKDYQVISVMDLYDMVGINAEFTDAKWGWDGSNIHRVGFTRTRDGFRLDLPKPIQLD